MNNLRKQFNEKIIPQLQKELKLDNPLAVPKLTKITVNTSSSEFHHDKDLMEKTSQWLSAITGQKVKIAKAKQSIAGFNLREGDIVGLFVTLRGDRMYDFFQKLANIVLPRTKDFQGVKTTSFDSKGNYTLGLNEQIVFPEVDYDKIGRVQGLEITLSTSANNKEDAKALLAALGLPFAKEEKDN
jgi:large subunit ribosomal protein L5